MVCVLGANWTLTLTPLTLKASLLCPLLKRQGLQKGGWVCMYNRYILLLTIATLCCLLLLFLLFRELGWASFYRTSLVAQTVKLLPAMQETRVWSLGWEDPLEKEMATHSSSLAWKIPWTEKRGRLQSMGLQRVGHNEPLRFPFLSFFPFIWLPWWLRR